MFTQYKDVLHLSEQLDGKSRAEVLRLCASERRAASGVLRDFLPSEERHRLELYERELWFLGQYLEFGRMFWVLFPGQESFGELALQVSRAVNANEPPAHDGVPKKPEPFCVWLPTSVPAI
jgi:hypothetical protein